MATRRYSHTQNTTYAAEIKVQFRREREGGVPVVSQLVVAYGYENAVETEAMNEMGKRIILIANERRN